MPPLPLPRDAVILFGSGVSIWEPSNVPNGAQVSDDLLAVLFEGELEAWDREKLRDWLRRVPFETINEFAPASLALDRFYSRELAVSRPNALHQQLAELATSGRVAALITPNYDQGVELAVGSGGRPLHPVIDPSTRALPGATPLFKVHGCTSRPATLVYHLAQEAALDRAKTEFLHALLGGRVLVVLGYSGVDFELCPAIARSSAREVWWGYQAGKLPEEYESPGYKEIASSIRTRPFPIDLSSGLPWSTLPVPLNNSRRGIARELAAFVSKEDRQVWALRLACAMGWSDAALRLGSSASAASGSRVAAEHDKQRGFALFQGGRYLDAANAFRDTARQARREGRRDERVDATLDALDAWRAGGFVCRALAALVEAKLDALRSTSAKTRGRIALKEALLLKSALVALQQGAGASRPLKLVGRLSRAFVARLGSARVAAARGHATRAGRVFDQKQLDELEHVFGSTAPVTARADGYGHLGYLSASTTLFRTRVLQAPLSRVAEIEATERYRLMCLLGNHPEAWKVAARMAVLSAGPEADEWERRAIKHQSRCQYTRRYRNQIWKWVRSGAEIERG